LGRGDMPGSGVPGLDNTGDVPGMRESDWVM
jgi:hypothetical protein